MKRFVYIVLCMLWIACSTKPDTIKPLWQPLTEAVYASGTLQPQQYYELMAMNEGVVEHILVKEGDTVQAGQTILIIRSAIQDARLQAASTSLRIALENAGAESPILNDSKAQLAIAHAKFAKDSVQYERFKKLLANDATAKVDFEKAELAFQASQQDLNIKKAYFKRIQNQVKLELDQAQASFIALADERDYLAVKAQFAGTVYDLTKKVGETVRRNEYLGMIGTTGKARAELRVDEQDVRFIRVGQQAWLTIDALQGVFSGTVQHIYPAMDNRSQSFRVDVDLDSSFQIYAGSNVEANIVLRQIEKALVIPKTYLKSADSVYVWRNGEKMGIQIQKGASDYTFVEITGGILPTDELIKP